jgi:resolvase-like protein
VGGQPPSPPRPAENNPATPEPPDAGPRTSRQVYEETLPKLQEILAAWIESLPPEAPGAWRRGAVYIRESTMMSVAAGAAESQLRLTLGHLARKNVYVPPEGLFFDVASGTSLVGRAAFKRLYEEAIAGDFKVIGVFVPDRLFRSVTDASEIKRQFRIKGIELEYLGKFEGDARSNASWTLETIQDLNAEAHARATSSYVGNTFMEMSRAGLIVGNYPEAYAPTGRAASFMGRRGGILGWEIQQPLASILQEGMRRYLAGASFADVAAWSATTVLAGVTPKGHRMNKSYWYQALTNPKFAGYQMPTDYKGYKPGIESPQRSRRRRDSELVPCVLPPLWTIEDYRECLRLSALRSRMPKRRRRYRSYLLSGVGLDPACGHPIRMYQYTPENGHCFMGCGVYEAGGRHSKCFRTDVAEQELDAVLAGLSFEDPDLVRQIEEELASLVRVERAEREEFRPNPAIASVRQAIATLTQARVDAGRADLEARVTELEALDEARREALSEPVVEFRRALAGLKHWSEVWANADTATKNQLLRQAGVTVELGRLPGESRKPVHVIAISAESSVFNLALAAALAKSTDRLRGSPAGNPISTIQLVLGRSTNVSALIGGQLGVIELRRPRVSSVEAGSPRDHDASVLTAPEFGELIGRSRSYVNARIRAGVIRARWVQTGGGRTWWLIDASEVQRFTGSGSPDTGEDDKELAA